MRQFKILLSLSPILIFTLLPFVSCDYNNLYPDGSGLIEATDVVVSSESNGRLLSMNFKEGEDISIGDTICTIDTITLKLRLNQAMALRSAAETQIEISELKVRQAKSNFSLAKKEFARVASLIKTGSANQQQYDRVENAYRQAELTQSQAAAGSNAAQADLQKVSAEIDLLMKSLDDCFLIAPSQGKIIQKYVEPGELIAIGKPIIKIAKLDTVWVKIYLPPSDLTKIKLGGTAEIDPEDGLEQLIKGYVSWISSEAEFTPKNVQTREARADLVFAVKIVIPNDDERLKIGMPVSVTVSQ